MQAIYERHNPRRIKTERAEFARPQKATVVGIDVSLVDIELVGNSGFRIDAAFDANANRLVRTAGKANPG